MFSDAMMKYPLSEIKTTRKQMLSFSGYTAPTCVLDKIRALRL